MRDYKNVKVPRKYRVQSGRGIVKRTDASRNSRRTGNKISVLNIFGSVVIVALCLSGWQAYRWLSNADIFQVAGVDVKGVRQVGDADLKKIVGEFTGQNIFHADLESAVRRARANPWIRDVRIHRSLPNRITMDVEERVPYAVLETDSGRYLIDREAVAIDRAAKEGPPLPGIVIRDFRPKPGETVAAETINDALTLLGEIEARGGWNISELTIKAASPESLSVVYADREFKMGSGNYAEKLRRVSEVMQDVNQRGLNIAYADLRPERQAAVMVKEKEGQAKRKSRAPQRPQRARR